MTATSRAPARISRAAGRGVTTPDWADHGLCAQTDPDAWFPELGERGTAAKAVCRRCPVRRPCLLFALATGQNHGIWGGKSFERDQLLPECAA